MIGLGAVGAATAPFSSILNKTQPDDVLRHDTRRVDRPEPFLNQPHKPLRSAGTKSLKKSKPSKLTAFHTRRSPAASEWRERRFDAGCREDMPQTGHTHRDPASSITMLPICTGERQSDAAMSPNFGVNWSLKALMESAALFINGSESLAHGRDNMPTHPTGPCYWEEDWRVCF